MEVGQNNQFTIPLNNYGLGSNGATITFNGNATIQINGQTQTFNGSWNYEVSSSSYSDLSITITSGTISNITITNKESGAGSGGTTTPSGTEKEFYTTPYNDANKGLVSIPYSEIPNNGKGITITITAEITSSNNWNNGDIYAKGQYSNNEFGKFEIKENTENGQAIITLTQDQYNEIDDWVQKNETAYLYILYRNSNMKSIKITAN
mgnify:CR=1 FL=1